MKVFIFAKDNKIDKKKESNPPEEAIFNLSLSHNRHGA
jgi:hypothetical protein